MEHVYSVSQVNKYVKSLFTQDYALSNIYIKGEVSNCKYHTSGHIYFTLKDEKSQISCVMFASQRRGLNFHMQEGQGVIVLGSVDVYERDGRYQLYASEILSDGAGNWYRLFEERKNKLEAEGLFRAEHKKKIPEYPKRLGIVTAATGAAIRDIMQITQRRNPYVQLILYPALVQGESAAKSIVKGIQRLDKMSVDTIIVGRGGGSIEDLWAFNEEEVVRAVYECNTPIISAVGHETDTTLTDFVADLRAPTPSAAAELAVGDSDKLDEKINTFKRRMDIRIEQHIRQYRNELEHYRLRLLHRNTWDQLQQKKQGLKETEEKLRKRMAQIIQEKRYRLDIYIEKIKGLSPVDKLSKGYAYVTTAKKKPVRSIDTVQKSDRIIISVFDGEITAEVKDTKARRYE